MRTNKMLTRSHVYVFVHRSRVVAASQEFQREHFLLLVLVQWQSRHSLPLSCSVLEHLQISCSHQPCYKTKLNIRKLETSSNLEIQITNFLLSLKFIATIPSIQEVHSCLAFFDFHKHIFIWSMIAWLKLFNLLNL